MDDLKLNPNSLMLKDEYRLLNEYQQLTKSTEPLNQIKYQKLLEKISESQQQVLERSQPISCFQYPEVLPVSQYKNQIQALIANNQVIIVAGETGSGKTTQLPKMCIELGLATRGFIGHTQPRRIAAISIANRLSEELNTTVGEKVGYQIRFNEVVNKSTLIKLMTDGILLNEIKHDPLLLKYQVLIIDEAHERSLNIDFILGYIKTILPKRKDLKVIITSATINIEMFSKHFNSAPFIEIPGRTFPVETLYLEDDSELLSEELTSQILSTIKKIEHIEMENTGVRNVDNILIFLPSERDIKDILHYLKKHGFPHEVLYPLFARLPRKEQARIFSNNKHRKIILSTNIAETSLTIPGIGYVIDSGLVRISRYNYRSKIQQLPIEMVSKSSADQRKGRCGREGPGRCYRLYTSQTYELMQDNTEPEILRTNLASTLLMSLDLKIQSLETFPLLDKPDPRFIKDAYTLLWELQALDANGKLSAIGKRLAKISIDPRLGRMILDGEKFNCLQEMLVITSFLAIQDPRLLPSEKKEQAKQFHARFIDKANRSDFMTIISLWKYFQNLKTSLSNSGLRKRCTQEYLNIILLKEWEDLVKQLRQTLFITAPLPNFENVNPYVVHKSCLSGLLSHIGFKDENNEYIGTRNRRFIMHPSSVLYQKPPLWLMCCELIETEKLYALSCAPIEPEMILDQAPHLIQYQYSEPHWSRKQKQAMIYRTSYLYGLCLNDKSRVPLKTIDEKLARELFIQNVLAENTLPEYSTKLPSFWIQNEATISYIQELESKSRRQDILIELDALVALYDARLPKHIIDLSDFTFWLKKNDYDFSRLIFNKSELMQHAAMNITGAQFPTELVINGCPYPITYHFDPSRDDDGVSVSIPLSALAFCSEQQLSWLIPGLLEEKCIALFKTLKKQIRKCVNPIAEIVYAILQSDVDKSMDLISFLCQKTYQVKKIHIRETDFCLDKLDKYYFLNIKIVDEHNSLITQGRNIEFLKKELRGIIEKNANQSFSLNASLDEQSFSNWSFDSLHEVLGAHLGKDINGLYPCLFINKNQISTKLVATPQTAIYLTKNAMVLFIKAEIIKDIKYLVKNTFKSKEAVLSLAFVKDKNLLKENLIDACLLQTFLEGSSLPSTKESFRAKLAEKLPLLILTHQRLESALFQSLVLRNALVKQLQQLQTNYDKAKEDVLNQLQRLFCDDFILISQDYLLRYPMYLRAMQTRLNKLVLQSVKDHELSNQAQIYEEKLYSYLKREPHCLTENIDILNFRFLLEEFRLSLFDQSIKTKEKVSLKRLEKYWLSLSI